MKEEDFDPSVCLPADSIVAEPVKKSKVGHLVECLSKVKQDGIRLSTLIKLCSEVVDGQDELRLAGSSLAEAALGVNQDVVTVKVRCYCSTDYLFKQFPAD